MFIFVWVFLRVLLSSFARDWAQEIIKLMWPSAKHRLHILRIEHSKLNTKHWEHRIKESVQWTEHNELGEALKNYLVIFCQGFFCLAMWGIPPPFTKTVPLWLRKKYQRALKVDQTENGLDIDKPARLTIVPDCQIRYKETNSETVTLSN